MGPKTKRVQPRSQATPLAEDFLRKLQGQLSSDAFGTGVGPLQREAGTAIQQYLRSLQTRTGSGDTPQTAQLISALQAGSETRANRQAADLREAFGAAGTRFGSSLATGEARLRGDIVTGLDQTIGAIRVNQSQFDASQLMSAIAQLYGMGQGNIAPFLQLAQLGILPEEVLASPGFGQQLLTAGLNVGANYLSGKQGVDLPDTGGGMPGQTSNLPIFQPPQFYPLPGQPSGIGMSGSYPYPGPAKISPLQFGG